MQFDPAKTIRSRPGFSISYGIDPNQEKGLLEWDWVSQRLHKSRNYWIASTRKNGNPHVAPVWGVYMDEMVYFGTSDSSRKTNNFRHNPNVALHLESGDETVIVEGKLELVTDKKILAQIAAAYSAKYPGYNPPPEFDPGTAIYVLLPKTILAWTENDFLNTATRWAVIGDDSSEPGNTDFIANNRAS